MGGIIRSVLLGGAAGAARGDPDKNPDAVSLPDAYADTHACGCGSHAFTYRPRAYTHALTHNGFYSSGCPFCDAAATGVVPGPVPDVRGDLRVRPPAAGVPPPDAERLHEQRSGDDREAEKVKK